MHARLHFRHDKKGALRARWSGDDAAGQLLARFFEAELGADAAYRDRLCDEAQRQAEEGGTPWRTSGNSFAVEIAESHVTLRPLFGADRDQSFTLPADEFAKLLRRWRKLVE